MRGLRRLNPRDGFFGPLPSHVDRSVSRLHLPDLGQTNKQGHRGITNTTDDLAIINILLANGQQFPATYPDQSSARIRDSHLSYPSKWPTSKNRSGIISRTGTCCSTRTPNKSNSFCVQVHELPTVGGRCRRGEVGVRGRVGPGRVSWTSEAAMAVQPSAARTGMGNEGREEREKGGKGPR